MPEQQGLVPRDWPQAVIFDLDGTLIDSAGDIGDALNGALAARGFPPFGPGQVMQMIGGGIPKLVERAFLAHGVTQQDFAPVILDFLRIYGENYAVKTKLYDGARPLLERLTAKGVKLGLCTNKQQNISEAILRAFGIAGFFGSIVGERAGQPRKPDPAPLRICLAELGVSEGQAVMVGDSGADAGAAQAAGVPVVLVNFGYTHAPVESLGADAIIGRLGELEDALLALNARLASGLTGHTQTYTSLK